MPTYHALNTSVRLCYWTQTATNSATASRHHETPLRYGADTPDRRFDSPLPNKTLPLASGKKRGEKEPPPDPATGHGVITLTEDFFEHHEGLDFLGNAPFYLVRAGKDIFKSLHTPLNPAVGAMSTVGARLQEAAATRQISNTSMTSKCSTLSSIDSSMFQDRSPEPDDEDCAKGVEEIQGT